jgi:hypothetical protein
MTAAGTALPVAGKIVGWLWKEKQRSAEIQDIVRRALRLSICRYDPCAEGVDARVKLLEDQMWEQAKVAADAREDDAPSMGVRLARKLFKGKVQSKLGLPGWEGQVERWVREAAAAVGWDSLPGDECPDCLNFPNTKELVERFPHMFFRAARSKRAANKELYTALYEADNLSEGTKLQAELEQDDRSENARHALHSLIWQLWGPPAGA